MNIPTSKKELLSALINGTAKLRREIIDFFSKAPEDRTEEVKLNTIRTNDSIIDVTNESYVIPGPDRNRINQPDTFNNQINQSRNPNKDILSVPFWEHQYVYSYSEIHDATRKQKEFYNYLKNRFLSQEFIDLEGNTNYAFILLFDLLRAYENHKNLRILENQLRLLGQFYPKTNSYCFSFLAEKIEAGGDIEGAERLKYEYRNTYYDYWKLGNKYKTKLSLTDNEVKELNKLSYANNNFTDIEYCCIVIIKLYLSTIKELEKRYSFDQTSFDEQLEVLADIIARKHFRYRYNSQNYKYSLESTPDEIRLIIFKYCENAVRERYGHKRKLNVEGYYTHPEILSEFDTRIIGTLKEIISKLVLRVDLPDEATDIELYAQNTNRWKIKFTELTTSCNGDGKQFIKDILDLGKLNKRNPSVENIFFEASKFISKSDREAALSLYIYYLHYDLQSATFDNKQLTKTIQKSLFKTNEQLHDFQVILSEFFYEKNLENALKKVPGIYVPKRKKIQLDTAVIKDVQQQHSGTVELLNEYLKDEYEGETNTIKSQEINTEELKIEITHKTESSAASLFTSEIAFTPLQRETLEYFFKNSMTILQTEFEGFARAKGALTNQLIDSLNEICYETLDDVLVEEDDEFYIINENYYRKLLAK